MYVAFLTEEYLGLNSNSPIKLHMIYLIVIGSYTICEEIWYYACIVVGESRWA